MAAPVRGGLWYAELLYHWGKHRDAVTVGGHAFFR